MPEKKNMPYNKICFILKTVYSHEADEEHKKNPLADSKKSTT
jgi:hypothetical protein